MLAALILVVAVLAGALIATTLAVVPPTASATGPEYILADVGVDAEAMVYDSINDVVYLAVSDTDPSYANQVVILNPVTGSVTGGVHAGSRPAALALSDDSSYLYVGLLGANEIVRIPVATFTPDLTISLGIDSIHGPMYADDIEVLPGAPTSIVITPNAEKVRRSSSFVAVTVSK